MSTSREQGELAETLACQYLEQQGLKLIERNFNSRVGELDLIMQHDQHLVFIEVRYRSHSAFGSGAESVTYFKQVKIIKTASLYLQSHSKLAKYPARFDVVSIDGFQPDNNFNNNNINWIKNAFDA